MNETEEIDSIYDKLENTISREDFLSKVDEKVEQMSGLCDKKTAALLVANDMGVSDTGNDVVKISDIKPNNNVHFIAKVVSVFNTKNFNRNDGTEGKVGNLVVADETGSIRLTLWDDKAGLIESEYLEVDQNLQISGYAKEGYRGLEVHIGQYGTINESDEHVDTSANSLKIKNIEDGTGDINLLGKILNIWDVKTFKRKDGSQGRVSNLQIGDDTGKIKVTLWDDKADLVKGIDYDDTVEIINGFARTNNYNQEVEIQIGNHGLLKKTNTPVDYKEVFTSIDDIDASSKKPYSVEGAVSGIGDIKEFTKKDGSINTVANIYLSDDTGRIRIAFWGKKANLIDQMDIDTKIQIIDAYSKTGFQDDVELSVGNRSRVIIL
ncbi:MAG: OB-fold nucleic acid binding domain-containing protein [Methanohalobium sp.]|uniref:OB-fold nucleic acid binding domain-containing protein n=1 Tax=Methanohalobium sp. TaxID=2837493 RepID=UPI00397AB41A